jgi:hypothetical protein
MGACEVAGYFGSPNACGKTHEATSTVEERPLQQPALSEAERAALKPLKINTGLKLIAALEALRHSNHSGR